jgi:hypothetical protein
LANLEELEQSDYEIEDKSQVIKDLRKVLEKKEPHDRQMHQMQNREKS